MEAEYGQAASGPEHLECGRESGLERVELVVDDDPERLEDTLRGMPVAEPNRGRNRGANDVDELPRPLDGSLLATADDSACDLAPVALLAVAAEDRLELSLVPGLHDLGGGQLLGGVHTHVERRVGRVREAALGPVDLHRREAEVEKHDVCLDAVASELREDERVVAAEEAHLDAPR